MALLAGFEPETLWFKTTAYPNYIKLFWAVVRTEPAHRDPGAIAAHAEALGESLKILDAHLAAHAYVAGDGLTMGERHLYSRSEFGCQG